MDTNFLMQVLGSIAPLSADLKERFIQLLKETTHSKRTLLLSPGQTCKKIWFLKQGSARAYYINPHGKQCTSWFMNSGDVMISVYSFLSQKPAFEYIEVLEQSTLQSISYQQLQELYSEYPESNQLGRKITEHYYILSEQRAILLRTTTPEERYLKMLGDQPRLFEKMSQKQVASYLGISHETLSRLRGKLPSLSEQKILQQKLIHI